MHRLVVLEDYFLANSIQILIIRVQDMSVCANDTQIKKPTAENRRALKEIKCKRIQT